MIFPGRWGEFGKCPGGEISGTGGPWASEQLLSSAITTGKGAANNMSTNEHGSAPKTLHS